MLVVGTYVYRMGTYRKIFYGAKPLNEFQKHYKYEVLYRIESTTYTINITV